jgi:hypothetical protein
MVAFSRRHFWRTDCSGSTSNVDHAGGDPVDPPRSNSAADSIDFGIPGPLPQRAGPQQLTADNGDAGHAHHPASLIAPLFTASGSLPNTYPTRVVSGELLLGTLKKYLRMLLAMPEH